MDRAIALLLHQDAVDHAELRRLIAKLGGPDRLPDLLCGPVLNLQVYGSVKDLREMYEALDRLEEIIRGIDG